MRVIVADTGPINYLILIGCIDILPKLFEKVVLPSAVQSELMAASTPPAVRIWMEHPPEWLEIYHIGHLEPVALEGLDEGEASAIEVALFLRAELLLMDERAGTRVARSKGIPVTGTLEFRPSYRGTQKDQFLAANQASRITLEKAS